MGRQEVVLVTVMCCGAAMAQGPLHHWTFEGDLVDQVTGGSGTASGNLQFGLGMLGQGLDLDGSVVVDLGTQPGDFGTSNFSVTFWFRTDREVVASLVGRRAVCSHSNFWDIRQVQTQVQFEIDQDSSATNYNISRAAIDGSIGDGFWHSVGYVRDGVETRAYVDGQLRAVNTTAGVTHLINNARLEISGSPCIGSNDQTTTLVGQFDDLRLYGRALAASEIRELAGFLAADLNADGCVDITDLAILLADFGCVSGCDGDTDGDRDTDLSDLAELLASFGQGC